MRSTRRRWPRPWRCSSPRRNPQGAVASRDYFIRLKKRRPPWLHDPQRRVLFGNLHQAGARQRAGMRRARLHQRRCVPVAVEALEPARHARRHAAGDRKFLAAYHELRNVAAPQVPVPLQHVAVAAYSDETRMSKKTAGFTASSSISPTRFSAAATFMCGPPAASASGSTCLNSAAMRLWR